MSNIVRDAAWFASAAHRACGQRRKYTGECYTKHLEEVATLVREYGGSEEMRAAAWLHDVVEDTQITHEDIHAKFGPYVADLVQWLTDVSKPEDGNRKTRKAIDRDHLSKAPPEAQTIKLCDLISNTSSIKEHDPSFAKVYLREKSELLTVMNKGNADLYEIAKSHVEP